MEGVFSLSYSIFQVISSPRYLIVCTSSIGKSLLQINEMKAMERGDFQYGLRCLSLLCQIWLRTAERIRDLGGMMRLKINATAALC